MSEGFYVFDFPKPISLELDKEEALATWVREGVLTFCNDSLARMYGYNSAIELQGSRLSRFIDLTDRQNRRFLSDFFESGLCLHNAKSIEPDREGNPVAFLNTLEAVVRDGKLVRVWGFQVEEDSNYQPQTVNKIEFLAEVLSQSKHKMASIELELREISELLKKPAEKKRSVIWRSLKRFVGL